MATITDNLFTEGLSGRLGASLVFRTMRGKTFVTTPARKPDKRKESNAQRNTRVTFREASQWAQNILLDAQQRAYYQQRAKKLKLPNAYTAALTDYMRKPQLTTFINKDQSVSCTVSKKGFSMKKAEIVIHDSEGVVKETRTVLPEHASPIAFVLTPIEKLNAIVYVYDTAERITRWSIEIGLLEYL